eukprot:GHVS01021800.1.p1 GENE.GHVS01021800.1~~GHVS01021800.1.p1  ORF type:complete len:188 (+),score=38.29 GHVS01021800.1:221-784(+)
MAAAVVAKKVLVPIADGIEELEAVAIINALRRAGATVTVSSVEAQKAITGSRQIHLVADEMLKDSLPDTYDCIALPGGLGGAEKFAGCCELITKLKTQKAEGRLIAAICASPAIVLEAHGLLEGETAVAYPALAGKLTNRGTGRVCVSHNIITSVGPASALEMAVKLIELLYNEAAAKAVKEAMLME